MPRKTKNRKSNTTILVITEGSTEKLYLDSFRREVRLHNLTVSPKEATHSSLDAILKMAFKAYDSGVYDIICCAFDHDVDTTLTRKTRDDLRKARNKGIVFLDSNPSFEVWFLAHFLLPSHSYSNQGSVIDELNRHIPGYDKKKEWQEKHSMYQLLHDKLPRAIKNCEQLRISCVGDEKATYSNVDKFFTEVVKDYQFSL
ncbi:MAG: RloB family protein [Spirochaetia bacterium]|jgi:hypothetical protein|nr:RloB family protein [Spirochaetia bacterium]